MGIPAFSAAGLLPSGVHACTLPEIEAAFTWNSHRQKLFDSFSLCLRDEIRSRFSQPVYFDGSFVTDKELPDDIDVVLEMTYATLPEQFDSLLFMNGHQQRLMDHYRVHFWVNFPGANDFAQFFQYVGVKTAKFKGLLPNDLKGILRIA